jgi:hypothetical protein
MASFEESFEREMKFIYPVCGFYNPIDADKAAIKLMCNTLRRLGYNEGIDIFETESDILL